MLPDSDEDMYDSTTTEEEDDTDDDDSDLYDSEEEDEQCNVTALRNALQEVARTRSRPFGLNAFQLTRINEQLAVLATQRLLPEECAMRLQMISQQIQHFLRVNEANADLNARGPGDRTVQNNNLAQQQLTAMADVPRNWKGYFESLSRADQRRFAGIFGPRLVRNDEELRVLNEALSDDGRIARLTKPYQATPVERRRLSFSNAYLQR